MKLIIIMFVFQILLSAQTIDTIEEGSLFRSEFIDSPFPHPARDGGHKYNELIYSKEDHYSDSTVLIFIPGYVSLEGETEIIVYYHGWWNNVDSVLNQFKLIEQFYSSGREAILVMPEGPKNAPDSFGGKHEEEGVFKRFIDETVSKLNDVTGKEISPGKITLAGHSGAYRVIAYILMRGGVTERISEVILFDGLYADVEKYSYWLDNYEGRFIDIYTPDGGTKGESENLMECLTAWNIPFKFIDGDDFSDQDLKRERIIFISSGLDHNGVISTQDQFKRFLKTGNQ